MNKPTTKIEKIVMRDAKNSGYDAPEEYLKDVCENGCQSGMVGGLIYYADTIKFYKKYRQEIEEMLINMMGEIGVESPAGLFGDKWDKNDPFANEEMNQNLLAWFAYEESARSLLGDDW